MSIQQALEKEIQDSKSWIECTQEDSTYKRDLQKRIELINWALESMKDPNIQICDLIDTKTNKIIDKINQMDSIIEAYPLHSELRILDWILYLVCSNEIKQFKGQGYYLVSFLFLG
jgi:hypothetical protein